MNLNSTIIVGLCSVLLAGTLNWFGYVLVSYLQRKNEIAKFFREKLIERYSEFVALVAADLERARSVRAAMALSGKDTDNTEGVKINEKRHSIRLELLRVSLQIRLLESDTKLAKAVEDLAKSQPFMAFPFPAGWGEGNYHERSNAFDAEILDFEKRLNELVESIVRRHSPRSQNAHLAFVSQQPAAPQITAARKPPAAPSARL